MYISHENFDKYHKQQIKLIRSLPYSAWTNRVSDNIENLGLYIEGSAHTRTAKRKTLTVGPEKGMVRQDTQEDTTQNT